MFSKNKKTKDGLQKVCKDCQKQYYEENKEKRLKYKKNYEKNNKAKILADKSEYYFKNKPRIQQYYEENKKHLLKVKSKWRKNNVEKTRAYSRERNEKMMNLPHTLTEKEWNDALKEFDYKCAYCGEDTDLEKDHFIPVSKNGSYTKDNILPSCLRCNRSKYNYDFSEWYIAQDFYNQEREIHILKYLGYEIEEINQVKIY